MSRVRNGSLSSRALGVRDVRNLVQEPLRSSACMSQKKSYQRNYSSTEKQVISKHKLKNSVSKYLEPDFSKIHYKQRKRIETIDEFMGKCKSVKKVNKFPIEKCHEANLGLTKLRNTVERYQTQIKKPQEKVYSERFLRQDTVTMLNDLNYQNKVKFKKDWDFFIKIKRMFRKTDQLIELVAGKLSRKDGFSN